MARKITFLGAGGLTCSAEKKSRTHYCFTYTDNSGAVIISTEYEYCRIDDKFRPVAGMQQIAVCDLGNAIARLG